MPVCPWCGKNVQAFPDGNLRPHYVPIEKRTDPKVQERCEGSSESRERVGSPDPAGEPDPASIPTDSDTERHRRDFSPLQTDLEGTPVGDDVEIEERVSTTYILRTPHFLLRVSPSTLAKVKEIESHKSRLKALMEKVKARPDAVEIPRGAKGKESVALCEMALHMT